MLFFHCAKLVSAPFLPLFVFDGPKRPKVKHGKRISRKKHWLVDGMKEIVEAFGFEWRMVCSPYLFVILCSADSLQAPGEAEAELAHLNKTGVIDAVLSDDVDSFLFGATTVIHRCVLADFSCKLSHTLLNPAQVPPSWATAST